MRNDKALDDPEYTDLIHTRRSAEKLIRRAIAAGAIASFIGLCAMTLLYFDRDRQFNELAGQLDTAIEELHAVAQNTQDLLKEEELDKAEEETLIANALTEIRGMVAQVDNNDHLRWSSTHRVPVPPPATSSFTTTATTTSSSSNRTTNTTPPRSTTTGSQPPTTCETNPSGKCKKGKDK